MTRLKTTAAAMLLATATVFAQTPQRPPAVPLVANDPFFSIWSMTNELNAGPTRHWTEKPHRLTSLVRIDGQAFRLMGGSPPDVSPAKQTNLTVTPTRSIYEFKEAGVTIKLTFMTPLLPDDLMVMSRPVSYITWEAEATDGKEHDVSVYLDASGELAVNTPDQDVVTQAGKAGSLTTLRVGSKDQPLLGSRGDDHRIDWGYFYLATPAANAAIVPQREARAGFAKTGSVPTDVMTTQEVKSARDTGVLATSSTWKVSAKPSEVHAIVAYDDAGGSIRYFNSDLKGYWTKDGASFTDLLQTAEKDYASLKQKCEAFDKELVADMKTLGGDAYVQIGVLAYRQSLAAQKIVADANGQPLSFSKENDSNGCTATVDVLYPASPLMMAFSPNLLKASLRPLMDYSSSERWKHNSAPHDIGQYPIATGQVYGGGDSDSGMPVEETGNMLCMLAALAKVEGNAEFSKPYWPTLTKWATYLKNEGFDPGNQLTTDDFAGHIARNTNLSAKAIMGVASYAMMADMLGQKDVAAEWKKVAKDAAIEWMKKADDGDHYALVFGDKGKGTWSQKYNIVWDTILDLNVFPPEVMVKEMAYYMTKMNKYGIPLDSRREYTKLDWEFWTATMATNKEQAQAIYNAAAKYANETPTRVPLSDWYESVKGNRSGFKARSVVGGVFIPFLKDAAMWKKYAARDTTKLGNWAEQDFSKPEVKVVVPAADTEPADWKYSTSRPNGDWKAASYDDSKWKTGKSGFGARGTPAAVIGTEWTGDDIWLRREFTMPEGKFNDLRFWVHHDEDVEIYINGVVALRLHGHTAEYITHAIDDEGKAALKPGKNVIALHCKQTIGGQYVDVGFVDMVPKKKK